MKAAKPRGNGERTKRRTRYAALLGASLALHAAVLGPLAWRLAADAPARPRATMAQPLHIEIEPRPLLPGEEIRPSASPPEVAADNRPLTAPVSTTDPLRAHDQEPAERPSRPAPRLSPGGAAAQASGDPGSADPWRVAPEGMASAVARTLRVGPGGCRMLDGRLTRAEQALCDERFNEAAGRAAPIPGSDDAVRDARFAAQGARERARYDARRAPLSGGVGVMGPADCVGSNLGAGCAGAHLDPDMRQGAATNIRLPPSPRD